MASFCAGKKSGEETADGDCIKYGLSLFTCVINFLLLCRSKISTLQSPFSRRILCGPDHFGANVITIINYDRHMFIVQATGGQRPKGPMIMKCRNFYSKTVKAQKEQ